MMRHKTTHSIVLLLLLVLAFDQLKCSLSSSKFSFFSALPSSFWEWPAVCMTVCIGDRGQKGCSGIDTGQMRGVKGHYSSHCWKLLVGRAAASDPHIHIQRAPPPLPETPFFRTLLGEMSCGIQELCGLPWNKNTGSCVTVLYPEEINSRRLRVLCFSDRFGLACSMLSADPQWSSDSTWFHFKC